ncbi:MAG: hypothetical protein ABW220_16205 [Burkholderiaceae bacterium]
MRQSPLLHFESTAFPAIEGEDAETNPGIFGKALAEWLATTLASHGTATEGVIAEDFGWCVAVASKPHRLYVACANGEEAHTWQVFSFAEGGGLSRLFGKDRSAEQLDALHATVRDILSTEASISRLTEEK